MMSVADVLAWADRRDQYRTWLAERLAAARIEFVKLDNAATGLGTARVQRFHRVMFRLPDGTYHTLDALLRAEQDSTSADTADDVAGRIAAWVKRGGWAEQGRVV